MMKSKQQPKTGYVEDLQFKMNDLIVIPAETQLMNHNAHPRHTQCECLGVIKYLNHGYSAAVGRITKKKGPHFFNYWPRKEQDIECIRYLYGTSNLDDLWEMDKIQVSWVNTRNAKLHVAIVDPTVTYLKLGQTYFWNEVSIHDVKLICRGFSQCR